MSTRPVSLRALALGLFLIAPAATALAQDDSCGEWTPGLFPFPGVDAPVHALGSFPSPSGSVLVAGGEFTIAYDVPATRIVQTDGRRWAPFGTGIGAAPGTSAVVKAVEAFDDALYVGGTFASAGGLAVNFFAKWNGVAWEDTGSSMNRSPRDLVVFDDGSGPAL